MPWERAQGAPRGWGNHRRAGKGLPGPDHSSVDSATVITDSVHDEIRHFILPPHVFQGAISAEMAGQLGDAAGGLHSTEVDYQGNRFEVVFKIDNGTGAQPWCAACAYYRCLGQKHVLGVFVNQVSGKHSEGMTLGLGSMQLPWHQRPVLVVLPHEKGIRLVDWNETGCDILAARPLAASNSCVPFGRCLVDLGNGWAFVGGLDHDNPAMLVLISEDGLCSHHAVLSELSNSQRCEPAVVHVWEDGVTHLFFQTKRGVVGQFRVVFGNDMEQPPALEAINSFVYWNGNTPVDPGQAAGYMNHAKNVKSLCVSPDGKLLFVGRDRYQVKENVQHCGVGFSNDGNHSAFGYIFHLPDGQNTSEQLPICCLQSDQMVGKASCAKFVRGPQELILCVGVFGGGQQGGIGLFTNGEDGWALRQRHLVDIQQVTDIQVLPARNLVVVVGGGYRQHGQRERRRMALCYVLPNVPALLEEGNLDVQMPKELICVDAADTKAFRAVCCQEDGTNVRVFAACSDGKIFHKLLSSTELD